MSKPAPAIPARNPTVPDFNHLRSRNIINENLDRKFFLGKLTKWKLGDAFAPNQAVFFSLIPDYLKHLGENLEIVDLNNDDKFVLNFVVNGSRNAFIKFEIGLDKDGTIFPITVNISETLLNPGGYVGIMVATELCNAYIKSEQYKKEDKIRLEKKAEEDPGSLPLRNALDALLTAIERAGNFTIDRKKFLEEFQFQRDWEKMMKIVSLQKHPQIMQYLEDRGDQQQDRENKQERKYESTADEGDSKSNLAGAIRSSAPDPNKNTPENKNKARKQMVNLLWANALKLYAKAQSESDRKEIEQSIEKHFIPLVKKLVTEIQERGLPVLENLLKDRNAALKLFLIDEIEPGKEEEFLGKKISVNHPILCQKFEIENLNAIRQIAKGVGGNYPDEAVLVLNSLYFVNAAAPFVPKGLTLTSKQKNEKLEFDPEDLLSPRSYLALGSPKPIFTREDAKASVNSSQQAAPNFNLPQAATTPSQSPSNINNAAELYAAAGGVQIASQQPSTAAVLSGLAVSIQPSVPAPDNNMSAVAATSNAPVNIENKNRSAEPQSSKPPSTLVNLATAITAKPKLSNSVMLKPI